MSILARSGGDMEFGLSDDEIIDQAQVRSYFPETWIYDEKVAEYVKILLYLVCEEYCNVCVLNQFSCGIVASLFLCCTLKWFSLYIGA